MAKCEPQEKLAGIRQNYDIEKKRREFFAENGSLTPEWKCFLNSRYSPERNVGMIKTPCRYQLRPKTGTQYHLCPEKEVETALDLASIKIPNPKSTISVAGRTYTFSSDQEITPEREKILLDFLTYCGEFELVKIPV